LVFKCKDEILKGEEMPLQTPEQKFDAAKDAVSERPEVEVDPTPLGGEGVDTPVNLEAEKAAREAKNDDAAEVQARLDQIREGVLADQRQEMRAEDEPVTHRPQWQEGYPTDQPKENPEGMMRRSQLDAKDGLWTKVKRALFERGKAE
jgi:hypothetical protein